ncbi:hypothetical protein ABW636_01260 [Aquimarina sp. 2201CG1-2-11]|uniref:hypothetical protein n=1 Tax=Aquimarina discodermiae TaxID=3231043 RepID=UPI0034618F08
MKNYFIIVVIALFCSCEKDEVFEPTQETFENTQNTTTQKTVTVVPTKITTGSGASIRHIPNIALERKNWYTFGLEDFRYDFWYEVAPAHIKSITLKIEDLRTGEIKWDEKYTGLTHLHGSQEYGNVKGELNQIKIKGGDANVWAAYKKIGNHSATLTLEVAEGTYSVGIHLPLRNWDNYITRTMAAF